MRGSIAVLIVSVIANAACAASATSMNAQRTVRTGSWGGDHVSLVVAERGARLEFDCATGVIGQPLTLDDEGRFDVRGTHLPEVGPSRDDETGDPARYRGQVSGDSMSLHVALIDDPDQSLGDYSLAFGARATLRKCR